MTETTSGVISQSLEGGVPGKKIALKRHIYDLGNTNSHVIFL